MLDLALSHNLSRYLRSKSKVLEAVDEDDDDVDENALKLWNRWASSDAKLRGMIRSSCEKGEPQQLIQKKPTALAMWLALEAQYEGKGFVLKYNAYENHIHMKLDDYRDITAFNIAFNNSIETMTELQMDTTPTLYPMVYIMAVAPSYPMWAERQRH